MPLPDKIIEQLRKAGLPLSGSQPFCPRLSKNARGEPIIVKRAVARGAKKGKRGYVDEHDRIWVRDRSHAWLPDHWDVQIHEGEDYIRVDDNRSELT